MIPENIKEDYIALCYKTNRNLYNYKGHNIAVRRIEKIYDIYFKSNRLEATEFLVNTLSNPEIRVQLYSASLLLKLENNTNSKAIDTLRKLSSYKGNDMFSNMIAFNAEMILKSQG